MLMNPFNPYYPAEAKFFSNRKREQEWFKNGLLPSLHPDGPGPWNAAILGPWGIGKSSLVRRLKEMAEESDIPTSAVFISCTTGYGSMTGFAKALIGNVKEELLSISNWSESIREELERWSVQIKIPGISLSRNQKNETDSVNAAELLRSSLRRFWENILEPMGRTLLLILDDANLLQAMDPQALMILRAVFQDLQMYRVRYGLVITGPPGLFGEVREIAEPVTRFFEHIPLREFSPEDIVDAIRHPLAQVNAPFEVADDAIFWIWERTKGHPYFVTFIMRDIVEEGKRHNLKIIDKSVCKKIWPMILRHLEMDKFSIEWHSATPTEREVLKILSSGRSIGDGKRGLLTRLLRKNLVIKVERGQYELYHPLFSDFVRSQET